MYSVTRVLVSVFCPFLVRFLGLKSILGIQILCTVRTFGSKEGYLEHGIQNTGVIYTNRNNKYN